ncbi:pyrophosphate--fructose 6-phosphate 1-phosphotransferase [Microbacterium faecale]|uniref:Pyrophosphate--fructose 6-phosphate 1-phosphotransferase n=1 Tax=Microbacterium faecale TaxID=1804630 RepID=A0A916Y5W2_9MICO|nr:6-phosphofructokinase [Microbacterium faecale]GGD31996.1 pyrophosphate--fructose 6-phosphate 1-phosphotransferase [Microbacterium faecale]
MTLLIAQTGAPTPVVNRSLAGFIEGVGDAELLFAHGGPDALVEGRITDVPPDGRELVRTGSWLRGGRRSITDDDLDTIVDTLAARGVTGLGLIGGNGTMAFLSAIGQRASQRGNGLRVVGIPKTIDNDIVRVDHTPGFASAARYLATTVTDMARDHEAMAGVETLRIVEVMGRDTGWLALAACYHEHDEDYAPDLVLTPEHAFDRDDFLADIDRIVRERRRALVVVSEGVAPELTRQPVKARNHTQLIQGGIARILAEDASAALNISARGEVIGTAQRCNSALVSPVDAREARRVGEEAGAWLRDPEGLTNVMVGLDRDGEVAPVALSDVGGHVRYVPQEWQTNDPSLLKSFHSWLSPLVALV